MNKLISIALAVFAISPGLAPAEVTSVNETGFALSYEGTSSKSPNDIYAAMISIGKWWHPDHSWSGDGNNLYIDERIGGCFCEKLPDGGGVQHLSLVYFAPGKEIRFIGVGESKADLMRSASTTSGSQAADDFVRNST